MIERITQAEFARRIGKSPQYVSDLVKSKKLTLGKDKKLDYKKAINQLDKSIERITSVANELPEDEEDLDRIPQEELKDYKHWKTVEAEFKAKEKELQYEEKKKLLVPKYEVESDAFAIGKLLQEQLLTIPERFCNIFAAESDPMVIRNEWIKETKRVLSELADKLEGGVR